MNDWGALVDYFMGQGSPAMEMQHNANPGSDVAQSMRYGQQGSRRRNNKNMQRRGNPNMQANYMPSFSMAVPSVAMGALSSWAAPYMNMPNTGKPLTPMQPQRPMLPIQQPMMPRDPRRMW